MTTQDYLNIINKRFQSGISKEHAYRADLENLLRELVQGVEITNEPANVTDCGNPDYVITKGVIPIGYIEAKDIGKDLHGKQYQEQFSRYKKALDNLIITDYILFQFFQNGELVHEIRIGEVVGDIVKPMTENFAEFENLLQNFCMFIGQTIKSPKKLAEMMAAKARLLQNILGRAITSDEETQENSSLKGQYEAFKQVLIHDLQPPEFADIYAQTLAYGMFAARLHDTTLDTFSRQKAAELIPKTNPFLRKLFQYVAGYDIDERIKTTVDNLAEVFRATNIEALLHNFGSATQQHDPMIHFYETFLAEYDPKLRKMRGVWYTPEPVVNFIVRAVDELLKSEFNLAQGLADTTKTTIKVRTQTRDKRTASGFKEMEQEVHQVQILDPAAGTGTFLAAVVKQIYQQYFVAMQGAWSSYVEEHLIPRLNGFELLMASYAMAHLKLDMLLAETGYQPKKNPRFNIYLTNSLEEHHPDTDTLFSRWLSNEANEANHIKRDTPVMVVLGNPPYSGESANKGAWIMSLMEDYKKEPGGKQKLQEQNPKWVNDDYVKFLRYGQYFIEKNGEGILAFINPHGFLDNPTFRGMRWNLLKTYDKIYTIDLHGNSKKQEVAPDGSADSNVFDIQQGVSINILVKTGQKKNGHLAQLFHYDLYGKREAKYEFLLSHTLTTVPYVELSPVAPSYVFVPRSSEAQSQYEQGFAVVEMFPVNGTGIVTKRDNLCIGDTKQYCYTAAADILNLPKDEFYKKYDLPPDVRDWRYEWAVKDIADHKLSMAYVKKISYRPFDTRYIYYTGQSRGFVGWPVVNIMQHFVKGANVGLALCRQVKSGQHYVHAFITNQLTESAYVSNRTSEITSTFPLYLYPETNGQKSFTTQDRKPNLNMELVAQIATNLGFTFTPEKEPTANTFAPIDIFDYIYAVLHSPSYREQYKEFLKVDFPRVPYPQNPATFWALVKLGGELRQLHLLESPKVTVYITRYPIDGDNRLTRKFTEMSGDFELTDKAQQIGRVWLNETQYFDHVPVVAWEFCIGGYQPAQKWLKDRRGRVLGFEDLVHYQQLIVALTETVKLMQEIDRIKME